MNNPSDMTSLEQLVEVATALSKLTAAAGAGAPVLPSQGVLLGAGQELLESPQQAQQAPSTSVLVAAGSPPPRSVVPSPTSAAAPPVVVAPAAASAGAAVAKKEIFPQKLMRILNDETLVDVVSWLPHGRSFVIIRPDVFTDEVLPKYLPPAAASVDNDNNAASKKQSSAKYPSFTRKLNRWYVDSYF